MASKAQLFLFFQGDATQALAFYRGLFEDYALLEIEAGPPGVPQGEPTIARARVRFCGQEFLVADSTELHGLDFTPALSLHLAADSEAEIERLAAQLSQGGRTLMPLGDYGFSRRFAWIQDAFGLCWQLDLPHEGRTAAPPAQPRSNE